MASNLKNRNGGAVAVGKDEDFGDLLDHDVDVVVRFQDFEERVDGDVSRVVSELGSLCHSADL